MAQDHPDNPFGADPIAAMPGGHGQLPGTDPDNPFGVDPVETPSWISTSDQSIQHFAQHILDKFGTPIVRGAAEGGLQAAGRGPISNPHNSLLPEAVELGQKIGLFNGQRNDVLSPLRNIYETTARIIAAGANNFVRAGMAVTGGAIGAIAGAAGEIGADTSILTGTEGLIGSLSDPTVLGQLGIPGFLLPEAEAANAFRLQTLKTEISTARATGAIGEGETGFYNAEQVTPENMAARASTARDVGKPAPAPIPPPKSAHELARAIEPEAFQQYDALVTLTDQLRQKIEQTLEANPKADVGDFYKGLLDAEAKMTELQTTIKSAYEKGTTISRPEFANADTGQIHFEMEYPGKGEISTVPEPNGKPAEEGPPQPGPLLQKYENDLKAASGGSEVLGTPGYAGLEPYEGTGATRERGLSVSVESRALATDLKARFGDLPEYSQLNLEEEAAKATALMDKDWEGAVKLVMEGKQPPDNLPLSVLFRAVETRALTEGKFDVISDLAQSSKTIELATTAGQFIRGFGDRDELSPVRAIQEIAKGREKAFKGDLEKAKKNTIDQIKNTIARNAYPTKVWDEFIQSIVCKE